MFYSFCFNKVLSKAFRISLGDSCLILLKNRNLWANENNFHKSQKRAFALNFLHKIDIQIAQVVLIFQDFGSYIIIRTIILQVWLFFCVLISVCVKQDLLEDLGESLFDLAEKYKHLRSRDYFSFLTEVWFWVEFLKYSKCSYCYRLFYFWKILFSLRCVLFFMILWFSLMSFCHRKVGIQYM